VGNRFFERPILNSPYEYPGQHWELDDSGQPTQTVIEVRRPAQFISPVPKPKKRTKQPKQQEIDLGDAQGLSTKKQLYATAIINEVRGHVDAWRNLPNPNQWQVTPETVRLLQHWRHHPFNDIRPFFCQVEAAETAIWLTEVAPHSTSGKRLLSHLKQANIAANPELTRLALKLATGSGKTTVMAMLIAWQTINAVRHPSSKFTRGFLVVTPGLTVKDRLRVLQPNDPDSYYASRELVPLDLVTDLQRAVIVITNFHAFKHREQGDISAGGRALLKGRTGNLPSTIESDGQMLRRMMPELMQFKNIIAINDEAHHCYREKPPDDDDKELKGEARKEAADNNEAARLWITGLETVKRKLGLSQVIDLSATPFFLQGSGYEEGTLFPWVMSDFSLMDAIECGIVKLPRVPVAQNIPGNEMPMYRNLWDHIGKGLPKTGWTKGKDLDPLKLPVKLQTALNALYGGYEKEFEAWQKAGIPVPPCFIIVCQNTSISKLVYDFVAGFDQPNKDGTTTLVNGRLRLFRNFDETTGNKLARPNTILVDSSQLEAGDTLDKNFRMMAADEIDRFRRERIERTRDHTAGDTITDQELLREVMNTVGKPDQLGGQIRCVVSVAMLTEGWDANTVTHILGIRAFGTQLLCEQVIGRALRRQSYDLNDSGEAEGHFNTEYADIFGIPFDFTATPVAVGPKPPPRKTVHVHAVTPDRDHLEICFPRVTDYRVELPRERLTATFDDDSVLTLTPELVGPTITRNLGIIGTGINLDLEHLEDTRPSQVVWELATHLLYEHWRDPGGEPEFPRLTDLRRIAKQWLETCLVCTGSTYRAQLLYLELADMACTKITAGITRTMQDSTPVKARLDAYNQTGSTRHVRFNTSKQDLWDTSGPPPKNHVNWVVLDSDWEAEFCRIAEQHPQVVAYTKNHSLGFEVPYRFGLKNRQYRPDFIALVNDGRESDDLLHVVVEIKGYRGEDAKVKKLTMDTYWIPGVNNLKAYGRWVFVELTDVHTIGTRFNTLIEDAIQASQKASS